MKTLDWQSELRDGIRDLSKLLSLLGLPQADAETIAAAERYPLLVPLPYFAKIKPSDPNDPLLLQILPSARELATVPGFVADPLGECDEARTSRTLQKYAGRVLILATDRCAVHCRFCFRRHFPKENREKISRLSFEAVVEERLRPARENTQIEEIILSGGDPLMLTDAELAVYVRAVSKMRHVKRLRIHTRLPVLIPQRLTPELADVLRSCEHLAVYMVVHVNHPNELIGAVPVGKAVAPLIDRGIPVLSQTVLLKGVNDNAETLIRLFGDLVNMRIVPYYLHQLDKVDGTAHFEVPTERARRLIEEIALRLPGYAVPRLVRELPGKGAKSFL